MTPAAIAVEVLALVVMGVGVALVSRSGHAAPRGPAHRQTGPETRVADERRHGRLSGAAGG
jgi:hypothetical protein